MRLNTQSAHARAYTHEGAPASRITPYLELRRSVLSCLLWEDTFYEEGESIAARIERNAAIVDPHSLANLAIEARQSYHLRHVPLLLLRCLIKTGRGIPRLIRDTTEQVISRPDEMAELLAIYLKDGKKPIPRSILKGFRQAAQKFDVYQLNKWDRDGDIKLRDTIFLSHASFSDHERAILAANIVNKSYYPEITKGGFRVRETLGLVGEPSVPMPETHEALIANVGPDREARKAIWEGMLNGMLARRSGSMPYMALIRNLRSMTEDGVNYQLIEQCIESRIGARRVLPFRYIQAARITPQFFRSLDIALRGSIVDQKALPGTTAICVDVSGSMQSPLSSNSQVTRHDAAAALAGCINGATRVVAFGTSAKEIPPLQGLALSEALRRLDIGYGTNAHLAVQIVNSMKPVPERIIVISDEQVTQNLPNPLSEKAYVINVAPYKQGIGYGTYKKIDGFSASTLDFIREVERDAELLN